MAAIPRTRTKQQPPDHHQRRRVSCRGRAALTKLGPRDGHVAAWINAVGALPGTPLIDDDVLPELEFIVGKIDGRGLKYVHHARPAAIQYFPRP